MNVAKLELCQELYELSGWRNPRPNVFEIEKAWRPTPLMSRDNYRLINIGPNTPEDIPAYDLGYLLRKLPATIQLKKSYELKLLKWADDSWSACYYNNDGYLNQESPDADADTPENAACKLAIELFKQEILTRDNPLQQGQRKE